METFDSFVDLVFSIKRRDLLEDFLFAVTSTRERVEMVQRVEIIKMLIDGVPQARIAQELGVGVATVTRGSKELAEGHFKVLRSKGESK